MKFDVAIIGAGIVGCASARLLAKAGLQVVVVDPGTPGSEASSAAAGMLAPQSETHEASAFLDLLLAAREIYPDLTRELASETGIDIQYRTDGMLIVALDEEESSQLEATFNWQKSAGLQSRRLSRAALRDLEPELNSEVHSGLLIPGDHQVENRLLTRALWVAARDAGAEFLIGRVESLNRAGDLTLELADGSAITADHAVVAAGAWSGEIGGLPATLPVEPVYGEILSIETSPPIFRHCVVAADGYFVPRLDGRLIVGASEKRVGFQRGVTAEGIDRLMAFATHLAPSLVGHDVSASWSGLRPGTPDNLPILGPDPVDPRIVYATGHYRNGILLGPYTGEIIAQLIQHSTSPIELSDFSVDRFANRESFA